MAIRKSVHEEAVATHLASASVSSGLQMFFFSVFLPILPGLLLAVAPRIKSSPKLQAVLKQVGVVIGQLTGE